MTMALPRPMTSGNRPAYLDGLFNRQSSGNASISSSISSGSTISLSPSFSDIKTPISQFRALSPAFEDAFDDVCSVRSKRSFLSTRKFRLRRLLSRRAAPPFEVQEINLEPAMPASPPPVEIASPPLSVKRTSFPKTRLSGASRGSSLASKTPITIPPSSTQELSCHRCYYFAARHCNGWVMGGSSGDACETCLQAGFFGAK